MSKYQELNKLMVEAMKAKKPEVSILKVVIGELQRSQKEPDDTSCEKIIRKMIANNDEVYKLKKEDNLLIENKILKSLLPEEMSMDEIYSLLSKVVIQIRDAKSDGQALGIAMKCLKTTGKSLNTTLVDTITKNIRYA